MKESVSKEQNTHLKYRSDIDGLRAIAVIVVLCFHAFPNFCKGGFVGVDIFFVISGYLISSILFTSLEKGTFNLVEFYSRRIKRIFPALAFMMAVCLIIGWYTLLADEYQQLGKHISAGAAFISNFIFWHEVGYFDNSADTKPMLHLWSLGIEEQYYIFWPVLLYICWKKKINILFLILLIAVLSFLLNVILVRNHKIATFYFPGTRVWELLVGSLWASLQVKNLYSNVFFAERFQLFLYNKVSKNILQNFISLFGILLIGFSIVFISNEKQFPGFWALSPALGSLFIIASGGKSWLNHKILSNRLLVWIGLISFPLYLWHWPLLSFARIIEGDTPSAIIRLVVIFLSFVLAWITFEFIEKPVRFGKSNKFTVPILLFLISVTGLAGFCIFKFDGLSFRINSDQNDMQFRSWKLSGVGFESSIDCSSKIKDKFPICATTANPNIAVFGDSHAGHLYYGFLNSGDDFFNKAMVIGAGSCQPTIGTEEREGCNEVTNSAIKEIQNLPSIKYVFLAGYYGFLNSDSEKTKTFFEGYTRTFEILHKLGKKIIFIVDNPSLPVSPEVCLGKRPTNFLNERSLKKFRFCSDLRVGDLRDQSDYKKFVESLKIANKEIFFYTSDQAFCSDGKCKLFDDGKLLYGDWNHLSIYGSEFLVKDLISKLKTGSHF